MSPQPESAPATPSKSFKKPSKKNQPGRYSQLVVDTIRKLGERNGSSLAKIYSEAKKVSWFDQQNGRTYLKYSIKALVQNDTLLQVKGIGANGSFRLNKTKLEGLAVGRRPDKKSAGPVASDPKKGLKKATKSPVKAPKKASKPKKSSPAKSPKKVAKKLKKSAKPRSSKAKKA